MQSFNNSPLLKTDLLNCSVKMKWIFGIITAFLLAIWIVPSFNQETKAGDQHPSNEQDDAQSHFETILKVHEITPDVVDDATGVAVLQVRAIVIEMVHRINVK